MTEFRVGMEIMAAFLTARDEVSTPMTKTYSEQKAVSLVNDSMEQPLVSLIFATKGGARKRNKKHTKKLADFEEYVPKYRVKNSAAMDDKHMIHGRVLRSGTSSNRQMKRGTVLDTVKGVKTHLKKGRTSYPKPSDDVQFSKSVQRIREATATAETLCLESIDEEMDCLATVGEVVHAIQPENSPEDLFSTGDISVGASTSLLPLKPSTCIPPLPLL